MCLSYGERYLVVKETTLNSETGKSTERLIEPDADFFFLHFFGSAAKLVVSCLMFISGVEQDRKQWLFWICSHQIKLILFFHSLYSTAAHIKTFIGPFWNPFKGLWSRRLFESRSSVVKRTPESLNSWLCFSKECQEFISQVGWFYLWKFSSEFTGYYCRMGSNCRKFGRERDSWAWCVNMTA